MKVESKESSPAVLVSEAKTDASLKAEKVVKTGQGKTRLGRVRQNKTRQDRAKQDKTRQDKTRQDKMFSFLFFSVLCCSLLFFSVLFFSVLFCSFLGEEKRTFLFNASFRCSLSFLFFCSHFALTDIYYIYIYVLKTCVG